jgi:hypothetical protein
MGELLVEHSPRSRLSVETHSYRISTAPYPPFEIPGIRPGKVTPGFDTLVTFMAVTAKPLRALTL